MAADGVVGRDLRRVLGPVRHDGRVAEQQGHGDRVGVLGEQATEPEDGHLSRAVVATDRDLGVESGLVLPRAGDERDDAHRMLPGRADRGRGGVGLRLLVREDQQGEDHPGGGRSHAVTLGGDGGRHGAPAGVLEPDHGRLQECPSRAIMS